MEELTQGVTLRSTNRGIPVLRIHYSADPARRRPEWKLKERDKYSSQSAWDREQEIIHDAGGGELLFRETLNRYWGKIVISNAAEFYVSPFWTAIGGFDHGRANPTAAILAAIDQDGCIICLAEYYMPNLGAAAHYENLKLLRWQNPPSEWDHISDRRFPSFTELNDVMADPSIFTKNQQQADGGMKSVADLYADSGLLNLGPAPNNAEIAGMERIAEHWRDLDHRIPSLKVVCPPHYGTEKKQYGLFRNGCPNLLWELKRTKREVLTAQQLLTRNVSEAIVDKDNHLRDCLKYIVLSLPAPARTSIEERLHAMSQKVQAGEVSATNQMIQKRRMEVELMRESEPVFVGGRANAKAKIWRASRSGRHYSKI